MNKIVERAYELRQTIEDLSANLDDKQALDNTELFPGWDFDGEYAVGERVRYAGRLFVCLQAHKSQVKWNPADAPSLWALVLIPDPEVIPEWVQPESTNPYMTGDKVKHNGKTWISTVDNNVWEPGVYGWDEITE